MAVARTLHNWLAAITVGVLAAPVEAQAPDSTLLALTGVTVIDPGAGTILPDQTVVVAGRWIAEMGPRSDTPVPRGAVRVDARGRYLLPGLWDSHVHTAAFSVIDGGRRRIAENSDYFFPLFLAAGITGVRDMSGELEQLVQWKAEIARGERLGPRMIVTGRKIGGGLPVAPGAPRTLRTAAEIRTTVRLLVAGGADFLKLDDVPLALWPSLTEAAHEAGLDLVGHLGPTIGLADAAERGQRGVEHLHGVLVGCSRQEDELISEARHERTWWGRLLIRVGIWREADRDRDRIMRAVRSQDPERCRQLADRLRKAGTWLTPTLTALQWVNRLAEPTDEQLALTPPEVKARQVGVAPGGEDERELFAAQLAVTGKLHAAGVPMLAGTDLPGTGRVPGLSLIDELVLLRRAGFSPMEALESATAAPARFLRLADSLGSIRKGQLADLVLVDADPLADLGNLALVEAVVTGGRYLDRQRLDSLRSAARSRLDAWNAGAGQTAR